MHSNLSKFLKPNSYSKNKLEVIQTQHILRGRTSEVGILDHLSLGSSRITAKFFVNCFPRICVAHNLQNVLENVKDRPQSLIFRENQLSRRYFFPNLNGPFNLRVRSHSTMLTKANGDEEAASIVIHPLNTDTLSDCVKLAASDLLENKVIAIPTDTVYGIAGNAKSDVAINRIFQVKKRNSRQALALLVPTIDSIYEVSDVTVSRALLEDLLPGSITILFQKKENSEYLSKNFNVSSSLVGVRIPNHTFSQELAKAFKGLIALTSANVSGNQSSLDVTEFSPLWNDLDTIYDGGKIAESIQDNANLSRVGSTIVDLSIPGCFKINRKGVGYSQILNLLQNKHKLQRIEDAS